MEQQINLSVQWIKVEQSDTCLLVAETHLSSRISTDIHSTEEHTMLTLEAGHCRGGAGGAAQTLSGLRRDISVELGLNGSMILLIDDIVHRIAVNQKVFLHISKRKTKTITIIFIYNWLINKNYLNFSKLTVLLS